MFHDLVVDSGSAADPPAGDAAELLAEQVIAGNCQLKNWDHAVEQWIARVNFAAQTFPELEIPPIGASDKALLIQQICQGATSYKEIKERPVWPAVKSWLSAAQQAALDQFAPERMKLPNGRNAKISYDTDAPTIAARIQDLYDVPRSLTIGGGRVPLRIQVLAPNNRPIQVTSDLETFWREGYAQIRPELQRRYPKHEWR
jgi:ATP-dependent helicase HrpB